MSRREQLQNAIGQTKLLEIIDSAYETEKDCPNCRALMDWWEKYGAQTPSPEVLKRGGKPRR